MPHTHQASNFHYCPHGQRGAALMIMLVIMVMGAATVLVSSLNSSGLRIERDKITADALAQAKDALIGFAITYGDTHTTSPEVNGYLPCPDINGIPEGSSELTCGNKNVSSIGKFPWKTLDLSPLRDGSGECLWYAVSGTYKYNPKTDFMNWDNNGQFEVMASDGVSYLAGSAADNRAVAVIFAPGTVLGNQNRAAGGSAPTCGGNYTASNYLDNDTVHSINNSTVFATANAVSRFIVGLVKDASDNVIVNDRVIFITRDDIFRAIKKRKDFSTIGTGIIPTMMSTAVTCLSALPNPITINFDTMVESGGVTVGALPNQLITGRVPYTACADNSVRQWRDNLLYAKCTSGSCTTPTVNGVACTKNGVVIFAGERTSSQTRATNSQKNAPWDSYLEGSILTTFSNGTTAFSGASSYSATLPSTDLLACIP